MDQEETVTLTPNASDQIDEANETIVVELSGIVAGNGTVGNNEYTITLEDSDSPPAIGFDTSADDVGVENQITKSEGDTYAPNVVLATGFSTEYAITFVWGIDAATTTATIDGVTYEDFEVTSSTSDGVSGESALAAYADLSVADRTITIPAGTRTIALPAITFSSDGRYEDQEQLVLTLTSPLSNSVAGSFIGTTNSKKILINNGAADVAPTVSIETAAGGSVEGAAASVGFNVTLDAAAGKDMYVKYVLSTTDGDYTNDKAEESEDFALPDALADRVFLIPAYATTLASDKTITLIDDAVYEYTEDIVINLETYTDDGTAALTVNDLSKTFTYTITEGDDPPILEFSDSDRAIEYAESNTNRSIEIQFKSSGTQEAEMNVYGYVSISTDASKTTAANGTDICEGTACSGAHPYWKNYEQMTISAGTTSKTKAFRIEPDDRYEEAQIATFVLQAFTAGEAGGIYYNSGYSVGAAGDGLASASNATTDGDEELVLTTVSYTHLTLPTNREV